MQLGQILFRASVAFEYLFEISGVRRSRAKRALQYLEQSQHPYAKSLAKAIARSRGKTSEPADQLWFDKIETLRNKLLQSDEVLKRQDFGAGHALDIDDNAEPVIRTTTVSRLCKIAGTPKVQAKLLYYLVKELRPEVCLELGTCLGISAAYQAAALNSVGKLWTVEGDPATAAFARQNLAELGLTIVEVLNGPFAEVLPDALVRLNQIDYVLIDGHHDGDAMKEYFALIHPWLSKNACVVFDDIDWSAGMRKAWRELQEQYNFGLAVDLGRIGIVIL
jgi:predicted O-methyltransferase YrrM